MIGSASGIGARSAVLRWTLWVKRVGLFGSAVSLIEAGNGRPRSPPLLRSRRRTAVAGEGEREAFSVSVGTPLEHVKWFRGRGTQHRSKSRCPDPTCCTQPPPELAAPWRTASWPSARVHSAQLASLPAGAFPGVDQTEVMKFLDRR
jgi:hypothetical protein